MFDRLKSLLRAPEQKASRAARLIALQGGGCARWTPRDYAALAREGYARNAIVYRAVRLIAESVGALSFVLYEGSAERDTHPLLDLIRRPNPRQDGASFLESVASHLLLAGNAYVEAVASGGEGGLKVRELYALRPDRMKLVPGPDDPAALCGGPVGNLHRHVPAAGGRARACGEAGDLNGEAVTRRHAR